jgi:O-antigen biosynthesis protein
MTTDIIIPAYNQSQYTVSCLRSIRNCTIDYRIVLIDNGSDTKELAVVESELDNHPHLLVRNRRNLGFVKAINQGLALATTPYLVLLNNDTQVTSHWLEKLKFPLEKEVRAGACGPITTSPECWQGREKLENGYRVLPASAMLAFFCVMLKKRAVDEVGFLDESFGVGLADDDDYCCRLKRAGYVLTLAQNLLIPHHHRTTFNSLYTPEELDAMTKNGYAVLRQKYGMVE